MKSILYVSFFIILSSLSLAQWVPINNGISNQYVRSVAIDYSDHNIMYVGTSGGGFFKSTNRGNSWNSINVGITNYNIGDIVIDPSNSSILYAGTSGGGVHKTTDAGNTWFNINTGLPTGIVGVMTINPQTTSTLFAGPDGSGIYKSTDSGNSWTASGGGNDIRAFAADPSKPNTVYAATTSSVLKTIDSGLSWSSSGSGLPSPFINSFAIDPLNTSTLYSGPYQGAVWKSTNSGSTWFAANTGIPSGYTALTIAIGYINSDIIYDGTDGAGVFRSTDGGSSWGAFNDGLSTLNINRNALRIDPVDPNTIYVGTGGGGIFKYNLNQTSELVAYYPFNGNADDESGNNHHGIVSNATLVADRFGINNSAFNFDGSTSKITVSQLHPDVNNCSISLWVLSNNDNSGEKVLLGDAGGFTGLMFVNYYSDSVHFEIQRLSPTGRPHVAAQLLNDDVGKWIHIVGISNNGTLSIYINGNLIDTHYYFLGDQGTHDLGIGYLPFNNNYWKGSIDDIRIYNRVLSSGEVLDLYHEGGWGYTSWQAELLVSDAGPETQALCFGQDSNASDSLDLGLGEMELPPLPPQGVLDARFEFPITPITQSYCDFRNDTLEAIDWKLLIQGTYPIDICWYPDSLPDGNLYLVDFLGGLFVNVDMKTDSCITITNPGISTLYIKYGRQNNVTVDFNHGWNIVSAPILKPDMHEDNYFSGNTSYAYTFYPDSGYITRDSLELARGYWLKIPNDTSYLLNGINHRFRFDLEVGWNMVGPFDFPVLVENITSIPSGIISSNFFEYISGYLVANTLIPGRGYWVKATSNGKIILDPSILVKPTNNKFAVKSEEWEKILIEDAAENKMRLYLSREEGDFELPPPPPTGVFDVRFTTGNFVEDITKESKQIVISSAKYPITISVEGTEIRVNDLISGNLIDEMLNSGDHLTINDPSINILKIFGNNASKLPISYELFQNYPNPFNPTTTIKFGIPKESEVSLKVYNILGEEVMNLVNEKMKVGYYEVEFKASALASGVYIYRIKAGNFVETKKMLLMK